MTDIAPLLDAELDAYVDNQLDTAGRMKVEHYLSAHPQAAARVMADLAARRRLRLALDVADASQRQSTREAARRLSSGLARRRLWGQMQRVAAVGLLFAAGWVASSQVGPFGATAVNASVHPPAYVEQAVRAHQTARLRAAMPSQPGTAFYDPEEIRSATAIVLPILPAAWNVVDVQVFPSDFGPSVEMSIRTQDGTRLSLFAVRPGFFAVETVTDINLTDAEAAYWQIGEVAYAIVASTPNTGLADEARLLTSSIF